MSLETAPADTVDVSPEPRSTDHHETPQPSRWPLSRPQAFCLHVTLSLLAFSTLVFVMLTLWFPGALFGLDGGWQGLKLVAMVDLVLGPLLTLVLYKPGKPNLAFDMSVIAAIQIAALGYGFVTTHAQRTVAVVHADGVLNTLSAQAYAEANALLDELDLEPRPIGALADGPAPLVVTPPPSRGEFGAYLTELLNGYPEPHERSDKFVAPSDARDTLADAALDLDELDADTRRTVEVVLDERRLAPELVQLHRFKARYAEGIALLDPERGRVMEWIEIEPTLAAAMPSADATGN